LKKLLIAALIATVALTSTACSQRVRFDEAAVEIHEVGSNAGVNPQIIPVGRYWGAAMPFSYRYIVKFPTTQQTYTWNKPGENCFHFINKDKVNTIQCITVLVKIDKDKAPSIIQKYKGAITSGSDEHGYVLNDIVNGPMHREIQAAFINNGAQFSSDQLYSDGGQSMIKVVSDIVEPMFRNDGINILQILPASTPKLPDEIVSSIQGALMAATNAKKAEAQVAQVEAEGRKQRAQADTDAYVIKTKADALKANPSYLEQLKIENNAGYCPVGVQTCIIGTNAPFAVGR
jgi:hypothetical protein